MTGFLWGFLGLSGNLSLGVSWVVLFVPEEIVVMGFVWGSCL